MTIWFLFLLHAPERKKKKVLKRVFFSKNKNQRHHHSPHYQITIIHKKRAKRKLKFLQKKTKGLLNEAVNSRHGGGLVMQYETFGSWSFTGCGWSSSGLGGGAAAAMLLPWTWWIPKLSKPNKAKRRRRRRRRRKAQTNNIPVRKKEKQSFVFPTDKNVVLMARNWEQLQ